MKSYQAPMEGITGYIYRNAYHSCFYPIDKYFTPFIVAKQSGKFSSREKNDILPEHNQGLHLVPQILTNKSEDFLLSARQLKEYGYKEVNLNLGCPSGTVTAKGKGAGFLGEPDKLERFLDETAEGMEGLGMTFSIKTRLGKEEPEEFEALLKLYNKVPLGELIIHPRVLRDYYKNTPRMEQFIWGLENSAHPVCYNGDIFDLESYRKLRESCPGLDCLMLGRGMLMNPFLPEQIMEGEKTLAAAQTAPAARIRTFHTAIYEGYCQTISGDRNILFKMKELWGFLIHLFPRGEAYMKAIRKAQHRGEYEAAVETIFRNCRL